MEQEQQNLLMEIINCVIFHAKEDFPGYRSKFVSTFSKDEFEELQKIQKELKEKLNLKK